MQAPLCLCRLNLQQPSEQHNCSSVQCRTSQHIHLSYSGAEVRWVWRFVPRDVACGCRCAIFSNSKTKIDPNFFLTPVTVPFLRSLLSNDKTGKEWHAYWRILFIIRKTLITKHLLTHSQLKAHTKKKTFICFVMLQWLMLWVETNEISILTAYKN